MPRTSERIETVVIGGGQAGLATGYYLKKQGLPFVILDANQRIGDAWRKRWDSLRLFTPARFDGLPGLRFPAHPRSLVSKDEMADYLESYAAHFELPVRRGVRVDRLSREGDSYRVSAGSLEIEAANVIVAMSNFQAPRLPAFAAGLRPDIVQMHASDYKNPGQLKDGRVLVVGLGNSGAEIALEASRTHETLLAGAHSGYIPFRIEGFAGRFLLVNVVRFMGHHVLNLNTPLGRKLRPKLLAMASPLVRTKPKDLVAAGVQRVARVTGVENGEPVLDDGRTLDVGSVVWCTGYTPGFSWIDLPIFDERGEPDQERGIVRQAPGLYFVGLNFLYAATSDTITGVGRDAAYVVRAIETSRSKRRLAGRDTATASA